MRKINGIVYHHSATSPPDSSDGLALYKMSVDPAHLRSRGILSKAEYHYIISRNGSLIRCASDVDLLGHCGCQRNYDTIGICCEGNLLYQKLTNHQSKTLLAITTTLSRQYGIRSSQLLRHKDVMATACPGLNFPFEEIKEDVNGALKLKPDMLRFWVDSNDVVLEYPNARGYQVRKLMTLPCRLVAGRASVPAESLKAFGLLADTKSSSFWLRDLENKGFKVWYDCKNRQVTVTGRENG